MRKVDIPVVGIPAVALRLVGWERGGGERPAPDEGDFLLLEDGCFFRTEDGGRIALENSGGGGDDMSISISLSTDGSNIFVSRSRELEADEYPCLLRRGSARVRNRNSTGVRPKRRNKWMVYYHKGRAFAIEPGTNRFLGDERLWKWMEDMEVGHKPAAIIKKAPRSRYYILLKEGREKKVCYGIGIYKDLGKGRFKRVSNICYFRSNARATADGEFEQWLSV